MTLVLRVLVGLGLLLCALGVDGAAAAAKKPKKPKSGGSVQQQASNMVMSASDGVQDCAGKIALDKGANKVEVYTKVTINSKGQVVAITTSVTVDRAGFSEGVKQCVDGLLSKLKFPPIPNAPLTTIERTWTIATS